MGAFARFRLRTRLSPQQVSEALTEEAAYAFTAGERWAASYRGILRPPYLIDQDITAWAHRSAEDGSWVGRRPRNLMRRADRAWKQIVTDGTSVDRLASTAKILARGARSATMRRRKFAEGLAPGSAERYAAGIGHPEPAAMPFGVSHDGAERLVAEWMKHLGALDASVTTFSGDGGVDVVSEVFVAQVKNIKGTVPISAIRELHGVGSARGRRALFFTSGRYTPSAVEFARETGMALFTYSAETGTLTASNPAAEHYRQHGLPTFVP